MNEAIYESLETINTLSAQVSALLELIMMADSSVTPSSITTGAEMALDIHTDLMREVEKIEHTVKGLTR